MKAPALAAAVSATEAAWTLRDRLVFLILSLSGKGAEVRARTSISGRHKADADANRRIL